MKNPFCAIVVLLGLGLAGLSGCGNWSNADVQFLYALPSRDQLKMVVPSNADAAVEQGLGTRRDGLALNSPSTTHAWTRKAADDVNRSLFNLLEILERAKKLNPSKRATDYREWGPFRDGEGGDREARLVIERFDAPAEHYQWHIDLRHLRESDWTEAIGGTYQPTEDLTRGVGDFTLHAEKVRQANLAGLGDDPGLRQLAVRYATDADPLHIEMDLVAANATLAYVYDESSDKSGSMRFEVTADWFGAHDGGTAAKETLEVSTRWIASGAGRADLLVTGGDVGSTKIDGGAECWDAAFNVVYGRENWDSDQDGVKELVGDPAACAIQP